MFKKLYLSLIVFSTANSLSSDLDIADDERVCWKDSDCTSYPLCLKKPLACRCQDTGYCLIVSGFGRRCYVDSQCVLGMTCVLNSTRGTCLCGPGTRYFRPDHKCVPSPSILTDMPRFADLPDVDVDDFDIPEDIPATYGVPVLIGGTCLSLVFFSLLIAYFCRHVSQSSQDVSEHILMESREEKIPLNVNCVPPPPKFYTPGFRNQVTPDVS